MHPNWREEVRLSLFADDMILYVEYPKDSTKKTIRTNKKNSVKSQNTKSYTKFVVFLYTNNQLSEREIKKTIPFTVASKRIKCLRINLTKEAKHLYTENYKRLMKEIKDTNKWKDSPCSWIRRINIVKMSYYPKQSIDSMQSLSKFQWYFSQK